jgi:hypothetical protein
VKHTKRNHFKNRETFFSVPISQTFSLSLTCRVAAHVAMLTPSSSESLFPTLDSFYYFYLSLVSFYFFFLSLFQLVSICFFYLSLFRLLSLSIFSTFLFYSSCLFLLFLPFSFSLYLCSSPALLLCPPSLSFMLSCAKSRYSVTKNVFGKAVKMFRNCQDM